MSLVIDVLSDGTEFIVLPGSKSPADFIVKYRRPAKGARARQPAHLHLIVDMYMKRMGNPWLTRQFVDYLIQTVIGGAQAATSFPPLLTPIDPRALARFSPLDSFGEYTIEFLLTAEALLAAAERTNYPSGTLHRELWESFRDGTEIYGVVSAAGWRG